MKLSDLPIFESLDEIVEKLNNSSNLIIKSPTGSGKSLGLPLLLLRNNIIQGQILIVQPRRIAARSLALKASQLLNSSLGDQVGYQVRFEDRTSSNTKIIYVTDGVLLRKIITDRFLSRVGLVIFDEFHERSLSMDTSLALLRLLQKDKRPNLRLILTSASLELSKIQKYLNNSKVIELFTRNYSVKISYKPLLKNDNIYKKVTSEIKKNIDLYSGHFLVFASSFYEISKIIKDIHNQSWSRNFSIHALHGEMSLEDQEKIISNTKRRKIIVSTNIAETSLTIEGIQVVLDIGFAKKLSYDPVRNVNVLLPQKISKSSAEQRSGRAGRNEDGYCIRFWSQNDHDSRIEVDEPAISKLDLSEIYLTLCNLNEDPHLLPWLDQPRKELLLRAKKNLISINAINPDDSITDRGKQIVKFPLEPKLALGLLIAKEYGCLEAFTLILSMVENRSPIIQKELNRDVIFSKNLNYFFRSDLDELSSDLKQLLTVWAYAKDVSFSLVDCKTVGIHSLRCREAEKLAVKYCNIANVSVSSIESLRVDNLSHVLLTTFADQIVHLESRGKKTYLNLNGSRLHLSKNSIINDAKWLIPLKITEKIIRDHVTLEMEFVTELKTNDVLDFFHATVEENTEIILNPDTRRIVRRKFNQLGEIKFNVEESEDISKNEFSMAYVSELKSKRLSLKYWDLKVEEFLSRVKFANLNYPDYDIRPFDNDLLEKLFTEICRDARSWKEIRNRKVLPIMISLYSSNEIELLDQVAPLNITFSKNKRPFPIIYRNSKAFLRIKIQNLYDLKAHPVIPLTQQILTLEILAPNDRCVQVTDNLNEFWTGSYLQIKKELAGRYPKHEWR